MPTGPACLPAARCNTLEVKLPVKVNSKPHVLGVGASVPAGNS
jgi:hypothetical protein